MALTGAGGYHHLSRRPFTESNDPLMLAMPAEQLVLRWLGKNRTAASSPMRPFDPIPICSSDYPGGRANMEIRSSC